MRPGTLRRQQWAPLIIFGLLITVPYILGALSGDSQHIFGGFLFNPIDGNSYLAKMYQGWRGDFIFHLPYTSEPGDGAFLFIFYIALGHIARISHLPLIIVFHIARVLAAFFLAWVLIKILIRNFPVPVLVGTLLIVLLFGLGLGWLTLPFGGFTSDFWVSEAYPFLASYANPHFPLGLGLMILLIQPFEKLTLTQALKSLLLGFILALVVPFGIVIVGTLLTINMIIRYFRLRSWSEFKVQFINLILIGIFSIPVLVYDLWVTAHDPILAGWNAQNITPSPPVWDLIISLSPVFLILILGLFWFRRWYRPEHDIFIIWLAASIFLLYLPFGLQRRMMTGIYIPAAWLGCAAFGVITIGRLKKFKSTLLVLLSIPTTSVILFAGIFGILQRAPEIYLWRGEAEAFDWIEGNTPADALILAAPDTGLLIPAYTGRRVLYGHPFETVNASEMEEITISLLTDLGKTNTGNIPAKINYIFWGPRETMLVRADPELPFKMIYQKDGVKIYQVNSEARRQVYMTRIEVSR